MIILFTSNSSPSGILQFVVSFALLLEKRKVDFLIFVPNDAVFNANDSLLSKVCRYSKKKNIFTHNKSNNYIARMIKKNNPKTIVFFDDAVVSSQICILLKRTNIVLVRIIHDLKPHPSYNNKFIKKVHDLFERQLSLKMLDIVAHIVLLSPTMLKNYNAFYPKNSHKTILFNLGAHLPQTSEFKPKELLVDNYVLFFGRIDRYKGLINFLKPFSKSKNCSLVIGGSGFLQDDEKMLIKSCGERITIINRFIEDGEMLYLFRHSCCVVLPYIEASQSGIIPIAYFYGKPVIVSNVEGLTQYVVNNETGVICENEEDYLKAITFIYETNPAFFSKKCIEYYNDKLDFEKNVDFLLKEIY